MVKRPINVGAQLSNQRNGNHNNENSFHMYLINTHTPQYINCQLYSMKTGINQ